MANEELQSFTDRLDQLFIRRSLKESSYLESLGEQLEESLERATGNIGDAVSQVEEAVRRSVEEGQSNVSVEGMSPPQAKVGIQQDVVTKSMIEAVGALEMAASGQNQSGKIQGQEQQSVEASIESSVPVEFSEETRGKIGDVISEEVSRSTEPAFHEDFFGGFTERVFNYIEGVSAQSGEGRQRRNDGPLQDVLEPLQSVISNQGQSLGTIQVGQVQKGVNQINRVFRELSSHTEISEEQTEQVKETFQSLSSEISEIQQQVVEEQMTVEQASEKIKEVTGEIQGEFETVFDGGFENEEEVVQNMKNLSGKFSQNMKEAVVQAQQMDDIDAGGISEIAIAVQQFTSEDLNVPFAGLNENLKSAKEKAGDFVEIFVERGRPAITAINVGLGTTLASLGAGVDLFEDARDAAQAFREETGIGRQRMRELRRDANRLRPELAQAGLNAQALADVQTTLIDRFGSVQTATAVMDRNLDNVAKSSAQIADSFGISAEKAAQNLASFEQLSRFVGGSAGSAITLTEQLARANDVAPQAVMEQIAENAEELAKFAGQSVERLASTAVEAQRLGVNLGEVTDFQEQALFNITDQIEKTQKANLLLDARIDGVRLLEASYEGTGATLDEIQRQVEGIDFENIDPFRAQALENVFGMSANQLEQIQQGAETLEKMEETTSNLSSAVAAGDLTLRQALASGEDRDAITRLTRQLNGLYVVFAKEIAPVISDLVENVLPGLTAALDILTPLVRGLGIGVQFALSPLQALSSLLSGDLKEAVDAIISPFRKLKQMLGMAAEEGEVAENVLSGFAGTIGSLIGTLAGGGALLKIGSFLGGWIPGLQKIGGALTSFFETQAIRGMVWKDKIVGAFSSFKSKAGKAFNFVLKKGKGAFNTLVNLGGRFKGMLGRAGKAITSFGSRIAGALPSFTRMGALFRLMKMRAVSFATAIPGLSGAMTAVSGALSTATTAMYGFATSLSATGIGAIALGIAAAVGGAVYAFYNWEESVQFVKDAFNSFMSTAFGVEDAASTVSNAVQTAGEWFSWFGSQIFSFGQTVGSALGLDYVSGWVSGAVGYIGNLISKFYEGKNAAQAIGSTLGLIVRPVGILIERVGDVINLISEWTELIYDLGSAIAQGNFGDIGQIIISGLSDVGGALIDLIFPENLQSLVANKMEGLATTIRSYLPFSPAEVGPLSTLDEMNIGGEVAENIDVQKVEAAMEEMGSTVKSVAKTVLPDPVVESASDIVSSVYNTFTGGEGEAAPRQQAAQETAATMTAQTVTIQTDGIRAQAEAGQFAQPQVRQEAGAMAVEEDLAERSGESQVNVQPAATQQPEMNVQPAQEGVATIEQGSVQTQSQSAESQQEIRVDSDTTSLEDLLRQIRNSQKQLLSELQNGNIAVYLDGRKVNREMLRNLNVVE